MPARKPPEFRRRALDPTRDYQARGVKLGPPKGRYREDPRP